MPQALVYALIFVVLEILRTHHQLPIMDGGTFIATVLVYLSILPESVAHFFPNPPQPFDGESPS